MQKTDDRTDPFRTRYCYDALNLRAHGYIQLDHRPYCNPAAGHTHLGCQQIVGEQLARRCRQHIRGLNVLNARYSNPLLLYYPRSCSVYRLATIYIHCPLCSPASSQLCILVSVHRTYSAKVPPRLRQT